MPLAGRRNAIGSGVLKAPATTSETDRALTAFSCGILLKIFDNTWRDPRAKITGLRKTTPDALGLGGEYPDNKAYALANVTCSRSYRCFARKAATTNTVMLLKRSYGASLPDLVHR